LRNILHDFDARKPSSLNKRDASSFTPLLHGQRQILPCFSTQTVIFSQRIFAPGDERISIRGVDMDLVYTAAIIAFLLLTLGLVAGCAALEKKK
jgi:hypothetical protein